MNFIENKCIYFFHKCEKNYLYLLYLTLVMSYPTSDWVRKQKDDNDGSDDSDWSELDNPGSSKLDKVINKKTRFNLHYHKGEIISIPNHCRIPLLPNEENYDWIQQRKLLSIQCNNPRQNRQAIQRNKIRQKKIESRLDYIDQSVIEKIKDDWSGLSQQQKAAKRRQDSLSVLSTAFNEYQGQERDNNSVWLDERKMDPKPALKQRKQKGLRSSKIPQMVQEKYNEKFKFAMQALYEADETIRFEGGMSSELESDSTPNKYVDFGQIWEGQEE